MHSVHGCKTNNNKYCTDQTEAVSRTRRVKVTASEN